MPPNQLQYAGFWLRVWASVIDTALLCALILPILTMVYGKAYWSAEQLIQGPVDFLLSWVFPALAVVVFWVTKQATPGKMLIKARIVDATTGENASTGQLVGRYFGYFIATIPLGLGLMWVGWDARKQGWHDKLAGTVVVRAKTGTPQAASAQDA
jgi:uncharacterized RDD family membrane protein YckC